MGATKTENFTDRHNELARMMKALAHPARIAILEYLVRTDKCVCGDIVEVLPLAQATVSQHLKELKNVGLVQGTIEGNSVCYCINPPVWNHYKELFTAFFGKVSLEKKCCS